MELDKPSDHLVVTFRGQRRELFMSFLRLNSCVRMLGEPDRLATIMLDPDMAEAVIKIMVAEKGGAGEQFDVELADTDLSGDDVEAVLLWVRDHLAHFFLKRYQQLGEQAKQLAPVTEALRSSLLGSES